MRVTRGSIEAYAMRSPEVECPRYVQRLNWKSHGRSEVTSSQWRL